MPDHVHLAAVGETDGSDGKRFIRAAKQYSGYYYGRGGNGRLWERYSYERVIRDDMELALTIGYLVENPVCAGLVAHPRDYPFLGSQRYTVAELLEWCEYRGDADGSTQNGSSA
jgi:putative transposase